MNPNESIKAIEFQLNECFSVHEVVDSNFPYESHLQYKQSMLSEGKFHEVCKQMAFHWDTLRGNCNCQSVEDDTQIYIKLNYQNINDSILTCSYCISTDQLNLFQTLLNFKGINSKRIEFHSFPSELLSCEVY